MSCKRKTSNKGNTDESYHFVALKAFCLTAGSLAFIAAFELALA
jgi:hypothetical protein